MTTQQLSSPAKESEGIETKKLKPMKLLFISIFKQEQGCPTISTGFQNGAFSFSVFPFFAGI